MAWLTHFETESGSGRLQPSQVSGHIKIFDLPDSQTVVQIDTYGSDQRKNPGKQSQTLQLGREAARELFDILKQTDRF